MTGLSADPIAALLEEEKDRLLTERVRGGLWLLLATVSVYGAGEILLRPAALSRLFPYRAFILVVVVVAQITLRLRPTRRWTSAVALVTLGAVCTSAVASGNFTGDIATMTVLSVVLVILSAAVIPWGIWCHGALVAMVALAMFWNVYVVQGVLPPLYILPGAAVLAVWFGSFYLHHELERSRRMVAREAFERKRAEDQARQHEAALAHVARVSMMGEMAAQMAHELNQPLAAIVSYARGCTRRMQSGAERPAEILDVLDQISAQAVRASEILKRLRAFVRKGEPRRERVQLNDLVRNALRFAEVEAKDYGVTVRFEPTPTVPPVKADAIQLEQVVLNLVRNGFEAMRKADGSNRTLEVRTAIDKGGWVRCAVRDTGVGIPADIADTLFEPFATTKPDGLGMGLSISRSIIESHGGRLWATPNAETGTTFQFTLPIVNGGGAHGDRSNRLRG
jgi:signal transduction histidine kinase